MPPTFAKAIVDQYIEDQLEFDSWFVLTKWRFTFNHQIDGSNYHEYGLDEVCELRWVSVVRPDKELVMSSLTRPDNSSCTSLKTRNEKMSFVDRCQSWSLYVTSDGEKSSDQKQHSYRDIEIKIERQLDE